MVRSCGWIGQRWSYRPLQGPGRRRYRYAGDCWGCGTWLLYRRIPAGADRAQSAGQHAGVFKRRLQRMRMRGLEPLGLERAVRLVREHGRPVRTGLIDSADRTWTTLLFLTEDGSAPVACAGRRHLRTASVRAGTDTAETSTPHPANAANAANRAGEWWQARRPGLFSHVFAPPGAGRSAANSVSSGRWTASAALRRTARSTLSASAIR